MPIESWPRRCPIGEVTGQIHIGRVYGKKTCGGRDCVKIWRSWNFEMQSKYTNYANMTIGERLQADQLDAEIASLREAARLQEAQDNPEVETPIPESSKDRFLKMLSNLPTVKESEEPTNGNTIPTSTTDPDTIVP